MQHLNEELLARLVDEAPSEEEALHLEVCAQCRSELEGLREQTRALAALPELSPPDGAWVGLAARLEAEGLVSPAGPAQRRWGGLLRIAAALALFLGGTVTGAMARGGEPEVASVTRAPARSAAEAERQLHSAEAAYLAALTRYSELNGSGEAVDPLNRLAALEGIVLTTRAALEETPADPVINGYHLAAVGQRDAILRQISHSGEEPWY